MDGSDAKLVHRLLTEPDNGGDNLGSDDHDRTGFNGEIELTSGRGTDADIGDGDRFRQTRRAGIALLFVLGQCRMRSGQQRSR